MRSIHAVPAVSIGDSVDGLRSMTVGADDKAIWNLQEPFQGDALLVSKL